MYTEKPIAEMTFMWQSMEHCLNAVDTCRSALHLYKQIFVAKNCLLFKWLEPGKAHNPCMLPKPSIIVIEPALIPLHPPPVYSMVGELMLIKPTPKLHKIKYSNRSMLWQKQGIQHMHLPKHSYIIIE